MNATALNCARRGANGTLQARRASTSLRLFTFALLSLLSACSGPRPAGFASCGQFFYGYDATAHVVDNAKLENNSVLETRIQAVPVPANPAAPTADSELIKSLVQAIKEPVQRRIPTFNVLVLSGGGQWGAYGAGFLNGWAATDAMGPADDIEGPPPYIRRDEIDIVTGVSTGSMQAPLVLAGSAESSQIRAKANEALKNNYLDPNAAQLIRYRGMLGLVFGNSLYNVSNLEGNVRRTAAEYMTIYDQMPRRKRAYVGTTDIDNGVFYVADLRAIIDARPKALDLDQRSPCFAEAVLASGAAPMLFPPRYIGGKMLVDGATRFGLFSTIFLTHRDVIQAISESKLTLHVSVIVNGNQSAESYGFAPSQSTSSRQVIQGSLDNMLSQVYRDSVYRMEQDLQKYYPDNYYSRYTFVSNCDIAVASNQVMEGCPIADQSTDVLPECKGVQNQGRDLFNPAFMKCLYYIGYNRALKRQSAWNTITEIPYNPPAPVARRTP